MHHSQVNEILVESETFIRSHGYIMPPFAYWSPERIRAEDAIDIRARGLGWDITDYGTGRFNEMGLFLFTVRNGSINDLVAGKGMLYAEKIMISQKDQLSPMHRHYLKAKDIINRGGGDLVIKLFAPDHNGEIDRTSDVFVPTDGLTRTLPAGGKLVLKPGESVNLMPGIWHAFWAEGRGCLIGEVSTVNNDKTDSLFEMPIGRFSKIDEDETPIHLLVSDY